MKVLRPALVASAGPRAALMVTADGGIVEGRMQGA
jgi:hypothetical protein